MKEGGKLQSEKSIYLSEGISIEATGIADNTLDFYESDEHFTVVDDRVGGSGIVSVECYTGFGEDSKLFQNLKFSEGILTEVILDLDEVVYRYEPNNQTIEWCARISEFGRQLHVVKGIITPSDQRLEEYTRVQGCTDLHATYSPAIQNDIQGFELGEVSLGSSLTLSSDDVDKFLPEGRFISLKDTLTSVIDPYRSSQRYLEKVAELHRADGFLELQSSGSCFPVKIPGRDINTMYGFSHPLKDEPNVCLVFVSFNEGVYAVGRALIVTINKESVYVEDHDDVQKILARATIDGETFNLEILKQVDDQDRGSCENAVVEDHKNDIVSAALTEFYEKYYRQD